MRQASKLTALTSREPSENVGPNRTWKLKFARSVLPAALISLGILVAACGNGGSPTPRSSANTDISQGLTAERSGQTQQAIKDFQSAITADPTDAVSYYDLGVIYQLYVKQPSQAAAEYNKALLANSSYRPAIYNLAIIETASNPQGAIALYQQLLTFNPNDSNVLFNLGLLLHAQGQPTQGQADVSKAVLINPALKNRVPAGITP
jgi:tetratricopeptide (TPR) repeat protein